MPECRVRIHCSWHILLHGVSRAAEFFEEPDNMAIVTHMLSLPANFNFKGGEKEKEEERIM
jgi:hypothetical protein